MARKVGSKNKKTENKIKFEAALRNTSVRYFSHCIEANNVIAELLNIEKGEMVSKFEIDSANMSEKDRALLHIRLLPYHTPQQQAVSQDVSVKSDTTINIERMMINLAKENDIDDHD